ncbi:MAG: gamma-glutamyltranspeptidase/glutathione hydrolase [Neolewinella sp.]|jgi:gamma-glutamyltranspeptidase/glutathione hydrolase
MIMKTTTCLVTKRRSFVSAVARACVLLAWLTASPFSIADTTAILEGQRAHPVEGLKGMVSTSHPIATDVALKVLKDGGNAIDAAVTAGFALAVTQPRSGNIGGGGFMLISAESKDEVVAIDYREKAPKAAFEKLFQDDNGEVVKERSRYSHLSAGVPGTVAGLLLALEKYGSISIEQALAPAINLAEHGFIVPQRFSKGLKSRHAHLSKRAYGKQLFYKSDDRFYEVGDLFVQGDLAKTLKRISALGAEGFYRGKTAQLIADDMQANGGIMTLDDLASYQAEIREPVKGTYRGHDIYSMSPPSSGGAHVVQILNILEGYQLSEYGPNSAQTLHLMSEAMKRAYADRAEYLGDTDFVEVPLKGLTAKSYAKALRSQIDSRVSTPSEQLGAGKPSAYESDETTHFSIVDQFGNAVSNTYTINFSYGSGIAVPGAGFLLNNEMDDFSAKPGIANAYGLLGGEANKIQPEKRMLSSMSPTIVKKDNKNYLVTGTPGGSRIITTTLQVVLNVIDHGMNIQSAVNAPRMHHQWYPDEIRVEAGFSRDTKNLLESMGHKVVQKAAMGASQSILIEDGVFYGAADPRRSTSSAKGY